ncbi:TraR/DksA C4-type zinc finger protein [Halalkalibacillus halophilus]|uniref:TraR/DksA C4-type zinc finger protein n=1 Tax=Halalkalibacillus halophilus TaxID=392827 RepID=UPI00041D60A7|nr:TraR/DksA C4-type zinc finger protein [Halalkalibacillus halophilus]
MEQETLKALEKQLHDEKERLQKQLEQFKSDGAFLEESVGELNSVDTEHPGDSGTEMFEREKDTTLYYKAKEQLEEVDHALQKMKDGTYGICERTGEPIDPERLKAMPTAREKI